MQVELWLLQDLVWLWSVHIVLCHSVCLLGVRGGIDAQLVTLLMENIVHCKCTSVCLGGAQDMSCVLCEECSRHPHGYSYSTCCSLYSRLHARSEALPGHSVLVCLLQMPPYHERSQHEVFQQLPLAPVHTVPSELPKVFVSMHTASKPVAFGHRGLRESGARPPTASTCGRPSSVCVKWRELLWCSRNICCVCVCAHAEIELYEKSEGMFLQQWFCKWWLITHCVFISCVFLIGSYWTGSAISTYTNVFCLFKVWVRLQIGILINCLIYWISGFVLFLFPLLGMILLHPWCLLWITMNILLQNVPTCF